MNRRDFMFQHWRHYLILEDDFIKTIRFVELDEVNFNTFSVEYNKQFQSICSEIDVICKSICSFKENPGVNCIKDYANIILREYEDITTRTILVNQYMHLELKPFEDWKVESRHRSPQWWHDYNEVKHRRTDNFKKANLSNAINSLAGLYLLEMYLKDITKDNGDEPDIPNVPSKLFNIKEWETRYSDLSNVLLHNI